jgi:2-polyprenyl-3-methyl-5-hydroxy-6-metoxy-1,4-benzoquinol methylase
MSGPAACRICSGPLRLLYPGAGNEARAEAFSPTNHEPGQYGDLYACERCGTVQQPSLPHGDALLDLYREMRDDHYLDEEDGRRRTARRLLDSIARHAPPGRLLDVGCGHGLLLDEARKAGHQAEGLELSRHAAAYARDDLGLRVREQTLAEVAGASYDVIVLADVLEHFDDPLAAIDHCLRLLAPGGVLCLVTPDPASRTARLAGASWWGYLPAHTFLLPRATLRELLAERGLEVVADASLVRSFSLRYWMAGLAERGGPIGAGVSALRRVTPRRARLSLSLGDETVLVARAVSGAAAGRAEPSSLPASSSRAPAPPQAR